LVEHQHEVDAPTGGMWENFAFMHCESDEVPDLDFTTVWLDPAVTDKDKSDSMGIQVDGYYSARDRIYRLRSWERRTSPLEAVKMAIIFALEYHSQSVGIETDQGGDTWISVLNEAWKDGIARGEIPSRARKPTLIQEKAGVGQIPKVGRANLMKAEYERGSFIHVRDEAKTYLVLEKALRRFPVLKPFDLTDAAYWAMHYIQKRRPKKIGLPTSLKQRNPWKVA